MPNTAQLREAASGHRGCDCWAATAADPPPSHFKLRHCRYEVSTVEFSLAGQLGIDFQIELTLLEINILETTVSFGVLSKLRWLIRCRCVAGHVWFETCVNSLRRSGAEMPSLGRSRITAESS
jgi:hypothetical protein